MKKSPLERLMETHPQLEIWWDSSPLIYSSWAEGLIKKAPPNRAKDLRDVLQRLFNPEHPEETLFRGVLDKLMRIPYFEKAYREDGLTPDEFNTHPVLMKTGAEFSKATEGMVEFVANRLAAKCG